MFLPSGALGQKTANADVRAGIRALDVEPVWAGHPVGFTLLTRGDQQYVAYYDADRHMKVAQRTLGQKTWRYTTLDSNVGWDSHNYVTMAFDREGYLHVSGNMHVAPLVYFRSTKPGDAASLVRVPAMTGRLESRVTYPVFSYAPDGALLFQYRNGQSGNGDTIRNRYDERTKTWASLTEQPLFAGDGKRNAYPQQPVMGPDGWYHQIWVWRETPMAETNHDLSYARSRDLVHWETAGGVPLTLPLKLETPGIIVDPSPVKGGMLNGLQAVGFDAKGKLILSYMKYDAAGNSQLYLARWVEGAWKITQASDWNYRWDFHGGGSLVNEIRLGAVHPEGKGLAIGVHHIKYGSGEWAIDPVTLTLKGSLRPMADQGDQVAETEAPGLMEHVVGDAGVARRDGVAYKLTWKTMHANRDRPRPEGAPPAEMLRVVVEAKQ